MIPILVLACSTSPETIRSQPAPAVADFGSPDNDPKLVLTPLTQMFERDQISPPRVLARLVPGMPREEAVAILAATDPKGQPVLTREVAGQHLDSLLHLVDPPVRLLVVTVDDALTGVNVTLPFEEAVLALSDLWGNPSPGETIDGKVTHVWKGPAWQARLAPIPDPTKPAPESLKGRGVLEIRPVVP